MADDRANFDFVAWDRSDEIELEKQKPFRRPSIIPILEAFVSKIVGKTAKWVSPVRIGGYNNLYRMHIKDLNEDVYIRVPQSPGSQFPDEKTLREAATGNFLAQNTRLPVPRVLFHGVTSPDFEYGPYLIVAYVENTTDLSNALKMPNEAHPDAAHMLNPVIPDDDLEPFYYQAAKQLLNLFVPSFNRIGSLSQTGENNFQVTGRPVTQNMNSALQLANIPRAVLPPEDKTYATDDEWYVALAEMHFSQLIFQHNDLVETADDCRTKYIARHLFLQLAKQGRLSTFGFAEDNWSAQAKSQTSTPSPKPSGSDHFRLWCDDLRAGNILLDDKDDIVAVIDWEFAYVAPTQFSLDPPWCLLLNVPEMWRDDIDDWTENYNKRLKVWLRAIEKAETDKDAPSLDFKLSTYMRESWETGRFWLSYAARKSWAFDTIFWKYLDERFFGVREGDLDRERLWKSRVDMLSEKERDKMEAFVEKKMEESKERILVDWEEDEARQRMAEVLGEAWCSEIPDISDLHVAE